MKYIILIAAILTAVFFRIFLVSVYKVSTQTMAPTLLEGDFVLVSKTAFGIKVPWSEDIYFSENAKQGDLITFQKDSKVYIKRVQKLDQSQVFVAGDNNEPDTNNSNNEPNTPEVIMADQIIGKPLFIWMSYSTTQDFISKTSGVRWNRILTKLN